MTTKKAVGKTPSIKVETSAIKVQKEECQPRTAWMNIMLHTAEPVIRNLAEGTLRKNMPFVCAVAYEKDRRKKVTHLEAFARTISGIAPWLQLETPNSPNEQHNREEIRVDVQRCFANILDESSADYMDFTVDRQCLVEAGYICLALHRAPIILEQMPNEVAASLADALASTRAHMPTMNNWVLFSAAVEMGLQMISRRVHAAELVRATPQADLHRVNTAFTLFESWHLGDGIYGDGPSMAVDYYNSYVIHPFLTALHAHFDVQDEYPFQWDDLGWRHQARAGRYSHILAMQVVPLVGTYPPIGRSITYRCGAFHALADYALRNSGSSTQCETLTAVLLNSLGQEKNFDSKGWLRIGLSGYQPKLGEGYISTGSLYMAMQIFLPLGLTCRDSFWRKGNRQTVYARKWSGATEVVPDVSISMDDLMED